jgi:hypothetical protein
VADGELACYSTGISAVEFTAMAEVPKYTFVDNSRPPCSKCGRPLVLTRTESEDPGFDLRIYYCAACAVTETIIAAVSPSAIMPREISIAPLGGPTMKWKLLTRDENIRPAIERFEREQHESKDAALQEACALIRMRVHTKVIYIEEPDGNRIYSDEIEAWRPPHGHG